MDVTRAIAAALVLASVGCGVSESPSGPRDAAADAKRDAGDASTCTTLTCESGLYSNAYVAIAPSAVVGAEFRSCFDGECGAGIATKVGANGALEPVPLDGGACTIAVGANDGGTEVDVRCAVPNERCNSGKATSLSIQRDLDAGPDASVDITYVRLVQFDDVYPNGEACAPHCKRFTQPW